MTNNYTCTVGCHSHNEKKKKPLLMSNSAYTDRHFILQTICSSNPIQINIEIRTQEKGFLQDVYVDEGQFVNANQLLFPHYAKDL